MGKTLCSTCKFSLVWYFQLRNIGNVKLQVDLNKSKSCHSSLVACDEFQNINTSLQWRHNECNGVSNHQPHDCLLNGLFRRRSNKTSKLHVTGKIQNFSFTKMHLKILSAKWQPFFPGGDDLVLKQPSWSYSKIKMSYPWRSSHFKDHLIFIMGIPILGKYSLYVKIQLRSCHACLNCQLRSPQFMVSLV